MRGSTNLFATIRLANAVERVAPERGSSDFSVGLESVEPWTGSLTDAPNFGHQNEANIFASGEILFGKLRPYLAKVWVANQGGCYVGDFIRLRVRGSFDAKFLGYALRTRNFIARATSESTGTKMPRTEWGSLREIHIPAPPTNEQLRIADFLDHETAEIDAFIEDLEALSSLSSSRWIEGRNQKLFGSSEPILSNRSYTWFPEYGMEFREGAFKHCFSVTLGKMLDEKKQGTNPNRYPYIRAANISDGYVSFSDLKTMPFSSTERVKYQLRKNDLLVVEGGSVGTNAVICADLHEVYFQKTVNRARPKPGVNPHYFAEILNAYRDRGVFDVIGNKSTIMHLTADKLNALIVPIPPPTAQGEIAERLKSERKRVLAFQSEVSSAITLSKERRAALISAAVTGQIDVTAKRKPVVEQLEDELAEAR